MVDRIGNWYPDWPGQQPYQDQAFIDFMRRQGMSGAQQQAPQQQRMTPPTIHAEIIQIDNLEGMNQHPVAPGASQMFMTKDEQIIAVRNMYDRGQYSDDIYDKRPPEPPAPTLNPAEYVRKDELQAMIAELLQAQTAPRKAPVKDKEAT